MPSKLLLLTSAYHGTSVIIHLGLEPFSVVGPESAKDNLLGQNFNPEDVERVLAKAGAVIITPTAYHTVRETVEGIWQMLSPN